MIPDLEIGHRSLLHGFMIASHADNLIQVMQFHFRKLTTYQREYAVGIPLPCQ